MSVINFSEIKKFVINLTKRPDRLEKFRQEMEWIGWDFEIFPAIDSSSYIGCALSHQSIAKKCLELEGEFFMVLEDDICFMPYAKEQITKCEAELSMMDFDFFHFAPCFHRPVQNLTENLINLHQLPEKNPELHRGIYGTYCFILNKKSCHIISNWDTNVFIENSHRQKPIDEYMDLALYPNTKSFSSSLPIVTHTSGFSDVGNVEYNNHYTMIYNWNLYTPNKLNSDLFNFNWIERQKYHKANEN